MHKHRYGTALSLMFAAVSVFLASCSDAVETVRYDFPRLELSTELVEFDGGELGAGAQRTVWLSNLGELPMGITAIDLADSDHYHPNFSVSWSLSELECPGGGDIGEAAAKGFTTDSGGGGETDGPSIEDTSIEDTSIEDTGTEQAPHGAVAVLDRDCRLPVHVSFTPNDQGTLWGSLIIRTGNAYSSYGPVDVPAFFSDPIHSKRMVYLVGDADRRTGNITVDPRRYDYGHLWPGTDERAYIAIQNTGDRDLTVQEPRLDGCADSFEITAVGFDGAYGVIEPGISTFVEVTFTPELTDAAACSMIVESDDEDSPRVEVDLLANSGTNQGNVPPTVVIRSPGVGHSWSGGEADSLQLQLNIFDLDQPADTLTCLVRSMVLAEGASVADCGADDESGLVYVDVPYASVGSGIDTIKVQVRDASDVFSYASISVLWRTESPRIDSDSDGWGLVADADGNFDCDDLADDTYPHAAELADGQDNDCDGVIDEGTQAYDDDGDSFSENDGDCNDYDEDVFTGAWEVADYKDNDCDGVIDEGTTLYDDDGDGYAEMDQDCDDEDPAVHPGAVEYCDGIDNDCNGLRDYADGCIETSTQPYGVGGIKLQQTACEPGDSLTASVFAYDGDGQALDYTWTGNDGLVIAPLTGSPSVTVTCPSPGNTQGSILGMSVTITDEDNNIDWALDELWVYPAGDLYRQYARIVLEPSSCATGKAIPALSLAWLALVGVAIRRRREDKLLGSPASYRLTQIRLGCSPRRATRCRR